MHHLIAQAKALPPCPGVYLFKDQDGQVLYIGKAKHLKKRLSQYVQLLGSDHKVDTLFAQSHTIEHIKTANEVEALLLEARLIQSYKPPCNVLLKSGNPFLYLLIAPSKPGGLPTIQLVRTQKQKGTYFGPFLEKGAARRVYDFLIKTFRLKICGKKMPNGCLYYHMGICSGSCRPDFDQAAYLERLELARQALQQGHKKFLSHLKEQIDASNKQRAFEQSRQLHQYYQAFEHVFDALDYKQSGIKPLIDKDIWVLTEDNTALFVLGERHNVLKEKRVFYFPLAQVVDAALLEEYFLGYYRTFVPPSTILINTPLATDMAVYEDFLQSWHANRNHDGARPEEIAKQSSRRVEENNRLDYKITILIPQTGHMAALMRLAQVQVAQTLSKQQSLAGALKLLFKLPHQPHTIDCFDISHKQGMFMVGSCVRFVDGKPDKNNVRRFHIKTVEGQNDYASLREIVARRYRDVQDLPDLILIDGGKGQLNAVVDLFPQAEFASLAKREETVFSKRLPAAGKKLDQKSYAGQVLIALRDYAHHFAISFHKQIAKIE